MDHAEVIFANNLNFFELRRLFLGLRVAFDGVEDHGGDAEGGYE